MIKKRDGRRVEFDGDKIRIAIAKAAYDDLESGWTSDLPYPPYVEDIVQYVWDENEAYELGVEEIQDIVEKQLMKYDPCTARAYVRYRYRKECIREQRNEFFAILGEKLNATNVQNQNANVDEYSFGGRKGEADSIVMKQYALDYCMSDMARNNHLNNEIYIHDLDAYAVGMHNCLTVPFDDLLKNGFNTRQTDVRPAKSINTAFQLIAVLFQLQSLQQFGGVSASHLDWTMVPYVRNSFYKHFKDGLKYVAQFDDIMYEETINALENIGGNQLSIKDKAFTDLVNVYEYAFDMTQRELDQAVEGLYHNLK